jgi:tetratricopeptide (TPR) repeat protein
MAVLFSLNLMPQILCIVIVHIYTIATMCRYNCYMQTLKRNIVETEVHFENIKHHIQTELRKAKSYVFVAVAWFTDDDLFEELVNLSRKGIQIQLLLNQDEINENSGLDYPILFRNGGMVYFVNTREILMHNKFCIIDKKTVLNGSFNWTRKASSNLENLTIIRDIQSSNKFIKQFESLKKKAKTYFEQIEINHPSFINNSEENSLNFDQLIVRAEKRKKNGNYLASLVDLKKAIEIHPQKENELLFKIANCQSELEDNENAIKNYSKYFELNSNSSAAVNNRGLVYENSKKTELAIKDFTRAIEINDKEPLYYKNRGRVQYNLMNSYKLGLKNPLMDKSNTLQAVKKIGNRELPIYRANFWYTGNLKPLIKRAISDYLKVLELDKTRNKSKIYELIAEIYYNLYEYNNAISYYTKVLNLDFKNEYAYYSRGWCYYIKDDFEKSILDLEKAIGLNPTKSTYKDALERIKREKRKLKNWFK